MGTEVPGLQLHEFCIAETAYCAEGGKAIQGAGSGIDEPDTRDQHRPDGQGTDPVPTGLDWLFREVPNPHSAAKPGGVDPTPTAVGDLEAVEARDDAVRRAAETGRQCQTRRDNGGQRPRSVAPGPQPGPRAGAGQCLLRLVRDSEIDGPLIAQPAEPPYTDPYVRWCARDSGRPLTYVYSPPFI